MAIAFHDETFRDSFSFHNSQRGIDRFPFPFDRDEYMYGVNIEPHKGGVHPDSVFENPIDIDEHYLAECRDRALTLERDPLRCQSLPHMMQAEWDTLELLFGSMARDYPEHFTLERKGREWTWTNRPLGIRDRFTFGDAKTLPFGPFEYATRQVQGDFVIMDQRNNNLFMDAGMITSQADWSINFDLGMDFMQWHAPVPLVTKMGILDRALKFLLMLQQGQPVRRLNWTMTVNPRLDTSPEHYPEWGPDRASVTLDNAGEKVHLRVELQSLFRLPRSNAIVFSIRCYLASLDDLSTHPAWAARLHRVLKSLPQELVDYKGLTRYRDTAIEWLSRFDHGQTLKAGTRPW